MSNKTVSDKVVKMTFDNQKFEQNVKTSMGTIEKLKKSLNFKDSTKSFDEITKSAKQVDLSSISDGIETVKAKFSSMDIVGATVLTNLTNKAVNMGTQLLKSITSDQFESGWNKYNEKTESVQTLVNSTGKSVEEIDKYLARLMRFSDETSYSFTDMASALAQMTSSGGDIEKLIPMITGIANATAFAGKGSAEFASTIRNLSQSYQSGALNLKDMMSLNLMGTSSKQLKETFIDIAVALGKIKEGEVTLETFDDTLSKGWADKEVMEKALGAFSKFSEAVFDAVDSGKYETATEAIADMADQYDSLSVRAFQSAQEAKSFREAIEATKDAVSSGFLNSFEIIFGNYDEAKKLWTDLSMTLYDVFAAPFEKNNAKLTKGLKSDWWKLNNVMKEVGITTEDFENKLSEQLQYAGYNVEQLKDQYGSLENAIRKVVPTEKAKSIIYNAINSFITPLKTVNGTLDASAEKMQALQKAVTSVVRGDYGNGAKRIQALADAGMNATLVQKLVNKVYEQNGKTWKSTTVSAEDLTEAMKSLSASELESLGLTQEQITTWQELSETAGASGEYLFDLINGVAENRMSGFEAALDGIVTLFHNCEAILGELKGAWRDMFPEETGESLANFMRSFSAFTHQLTPSEETLDKLRRTFRGIFAIVKMVTTVVSTLVSAALKPLGLTAKNAGGSLLTVTASLGDMLVAFSEMVDSNSVLRIFGSLFENIASGIKVVIGFLKELVSIMGESFKMAFMENLNPISGLFDGIVTAISSAIIWILRLVGVLDDESEAMLYASNGWKKFRKIVNTVTDAIDNFCNKIFGIDKATETSLDKNGNVIGNRFKFFGESMIEGLKKGASNGWSGLKNIFQGIVNKIKNIFTNDQTGFGIHSPAKFFEWVGNMAVEGIRIGFKGMELVIKFLAKTLKNGINQITKLSLTDVLDKLRNSLTKLVNSTQNMTISAGAGFSSLIAVISNAASTLMSKLKPVMDYLKTVNWDRVIDITVGLAKAIGLLKVGSGLQKFGDGFEAFGIGFKKGFTNLGKGLKSLGKSLQAKYISSAIQSLTLLVGIISVLLVVMTQIPKENLNQSKQVLMDLVSEIGSLFIIIALVSKIPTKDAGSLKGLAMFISAVALAAVSIAASVKILIGCIETMKGIMDKRAEYADTFQAVTSMVVALFGFSALLAIIGNKMGKLSGVAAAVPIVAIALSMHILISALEKIMNIQFNNDEMIERFTMFEGLLVTLGGIATLISAVGGKGGTGIGAGVAILAMVYSIGLIGEQLVSLSESLRKLQPGDIGSLVLVLATFFGAIALVLHTTQGVKASALGGLVLLVTSFIGFIFTFSAVISALQGVEFNGSMVVMLAGIGVLLAGLIALTAVIGGKSIDSKKVLISLAGLTAFLLAISGMLYLVMGLLQTGADWKELLVVFGGIAAIIAVMGLITGLANKMTGAGIGSLVAMSALLLVVVTSLMALTYIDYESIKNSMFAIGVTLGVIAGVLAVLAIVFEAVAPGAAVLAGVLMSMAMVITAVGIAMFLGAAAFNLFMDAILRLKDVTAEEMQNILDNLSAFVYGLITQVVPAAIQGIIDLFVQSCEKFVEFLGNLLAWAWEGLSEAWWDIKDMFTQFKEDAIEWLIGKGEAFLDAGRDMLEGIGKGFEGAWDWFKEKLSDFGQKIKDFFSPSHWLEVGANLGQGLGNGLSGEETGLKKVANKVVGGIKDVFTGKKGFDTHSPSKWSEGIGNFLIQGLTNGISTQAQKDDSIIGKVVGGLKDTISDKLGSPFANLSETLDLSNKLQLPDTLTSPTITPVVDMSNFNTDIGNMSAQMNGLTFDNAAFNSASVNASLASSFVSDTDNTRSILTEIKGLRQDTQNLNDSLANTNLYLDGDALVGGIANRMNTTLGRMVTYRGRGN